MRVPTLFNAGFRPFFVLAAVWAPLGVGLWVFGLVGGYVTEGPLPLLRWHAHELLSGFVAAAMLGFLLTAIPNWTNGPPYGGWKLAGLAGLFLAARLVLLPGSPVPVGAGAVLALAVLPAALLLVLPALIGARSPRVLGPPAVVLAFWIGDLLMLGDAARWWPWASWATGQMLAANLAMTMVGLIGGRIIPPFTQNALRRAGRTVAIRPLPWLDRTGFLSLLAVVMVDLFWPASVLAGITAAAAAAANAGRLSRWRGRLTLGQPILWVLHLGYGFIPLSLTVKAVWLLTALPWTANWLHLQTVGVLAVMIVAMMSRVTLGHTGRGLCAVPAIVWCYVAIALTAFLRAFGSISGVDLRAVFVGAALVWVLGFGLFLCVYLPILVGSMPDNDANNRPNPS